MSARFDILDPKHASFDLFDNPLSKHIWKEKYKKEDADVHGTFNRVVHHILRDYDEKYRQRACDLMCAGILMPAGRILAGAGTGNKVTLMNCYVSGTIEDSLVDIMKKLDEAARTMQQGGGIGMNFGTLRPKGAILKSTGSIASGPIPFMDMWDSMCRTIMSAGHRRGAMMGVITDTHPDLIDFIKAKQTKGRMTSFNVSILISDAFMKAVKDDDNWYLRFPAEPVDYKASDPGRLYMEAQGTEPRDSYIYSSHKARDIWNLITRSTYEYSEPGVIFIDRINKQNNLSYCETIACTNPCGEQPLPPYGTCNLGAINLARLVRNPFTPNAHLDWDLMHESVRIMVNFLDNVIERTNYPLEDHCIEEYQKRRIGLGVSGLADALSQIGLPYGSPNACVYTMDLMRDFAVTAYNESVNLTLEFGPFSLYEPEILDAPFLEKLPPEIRGRIRRHGIRNGVLLTVAPTGTTSVFYGDISSGCEPVYSHKTTRKVLKPDDAWEQFTQYSFISRFYAHCKGIDLEKAVNDLTYQKIAPTTEELTIAQHVKMQAAIQKWVDASVSKTVNIPISTPFEEFVKVYDLAYELGCKGCTTYRPSAVRGSILEAAKTTNEKMDSLIASDFNSPDEKSLSPTPQQPEPPKRAEVLEGVTHKITWPGLASAVYVTLNRNEEGHLSEVFIASKNAQNTEWTIALSVMISRLLKLTQDPLGVAEELMQINLSNNPSWQGGKFYGSIVARIGAIIKQHAENHIHIPDLDLKGRAGLQETARSHGVVQSGRGKGEGDAIVPDFGEVQYRFHTEAHWPGKVCIKCGSYNLKAQEGCIVCEDCGHSNCE